MGCIADLVFYATAACMFAQVNYELTEREKAGALGAPRGGGQAMTCVEIKILRHVRAESPHHPPRHRRDACSMVWRCRCLTARRSDTMVDFHTEQYASITNGDGPAYGSG